MSRERREAEEKEAWDKERAMKKVLDAERGAEEEKGGERERRGKGKGGELGGLAVSRPFVLRVPFRGRYLVRDGKFLFSLSLFLFYSILF